MQQVEKKSTHINLTDDVMKHRDMLSAHRLNTFPYLNRLILMIEHRELFSSFINDLNVRLISFYSLFYTLFFVTDNSFACAHDLGIVHGCRWCAS